MRPMSLLDIVREARRRNRGHEWLEVYRGALGEAMSAGDLATAGELTSMAAIALESDGRLAEALEQLDHGITVVGSHRLPRAHLRSVQAAFLASSGRIDDARLALADARASLGDEERTRPFLEWRAYGAVVGAIAIDPNLSASLRAAAADCDLMGLTWLSTGIRRWAVPYEVATGNADAVASLLDEIGAVAVREENRWRLDDVESFDAATAARRLIPDARALGTMADASTNRDARWLLCCLAAWAESVASHRAPLPGALGGRLQAAAHALPAEHRLTATSIATLLDALGLDEREVRLSPPDHVTLASLPGVLAGALAVAFAGSRSTVGSWGEWWDSAFPPHVATALEWPVAAVRCRALLDLRLGRRAEVGFLNARSWALGAGYQIEAAICGIQLAEVQALGRTPYAERGWRELRRASFDALRAGGGDPIMAAASAARVLALGGGRAGEERLTEREIDVLRVLAQGQSLKGAGAVLELSWQTVQTHAKNAYRKLEVHNRVDAIRVASERRLI